MGVFAVAEFKFDGPEMIFEWNKKMLFWVFANGFQKPNSKFKIKIMVLTTISRFSEIQNFQIINLGKAFGPMGKAMPKKRKS